MEMSGLRLNLGCGPNAVDGWINIDRSPNVVLDRLPAVKQSLAKLRILSAPHMESWPREVVRVDVRKGLDYPTGSATAIYSSHMLEHMYLEEARAVLRESRRILAPGGVLRLALPDGEQIAADLIKGVAPDGEDPGLEFNRRLCAFSFEPPTRRQRIVGKFGGSPHRWQPTRGLVTMLLRQAGYSTVEECTFQVGRLPDVASVEHREESFFLEAL